MSKRYKKSALKLSKNVFSLKDFDVYYHDADPAISKRKDAARYISYAGGHHHLNIALQKSGWSKSKVLSSKHKVNLIVCDRPVMKRAVTLFRSWL